jgi:hypothetical protein
LGNWFFFGSYFGHKPLLYLGIGILFNFEQASAEAKAGIQFIQPI